MRKKKNHQFTTCIIILEKLCDINIKEKNKTVL